MKDYPTGRLSNNARRVAIAIVASGIVAAPAAYAKSFNNLVIVTPIGLPEIARQAGEAMFLHQEVDGSTFLYVEQSDGTRLAVLDVTDPAHIKAKGLVQLDAPGPFDFVSTLGNRADLVRFRHGHGDAVLDLHKPSVPTLKRLQGLTLQGPTLLLGADSFTVTSQPDADARPTRDYQVVDTANSQELTRVFDVKRVRQEIANGNTGTTFLLTESGLYLIRRPAIEIDAQRREMNDVN
jgi:hypothetical protein